MAIRQRLDGDASGAVKAIGDLKKAISKSDEELKKTTKSAKGLEGAARRVAEQADPQKRYNRQVDNLAQLVKKGKVSLEDAEIVAGKYQRRLEGVSGAGKKAFNLANIRNFAGEIIAASGAVSLLKQGLEELKQERLQAASSFSQAAPGLAELIQLAAPTDDPKATKRKLDKEARQFFAQGVGKTLDEAAGQLYGLISANVSAPDRQFAGALSSRGILSDVSGAAAAAASLQTELGEEETGGFRDLISKGFAASEIAPTLSHEIIQGAAKAGGSAGRLGLSDEFVLAATAITGKARGSASEGGTQIAAFLKGIEKNAGGQFEGKTGLEIVQELASKNLDRAGLAKYVGQDAEAISGAATLIKNHELLQSLYGKVSAANTSDLGGVAIRLADSDTTLYADRQRRMAANKRLLQQEDEAAAANLVDGIFDRRVTQGRKVDPGFVTEASVFVGKGALEVSRLMETNMQLLERALNDGLGGVTPQDRERAYQLMGRQIEALDRNSAAIELSGAMTGPAE